MLLRAIGFLALFHGCLCAQRQPAARPQTDGGLEGPAEARAIVDKILLANGELKTVVAAMKPQGWERNGAPSSYVIQWQSAQQQAIDVDTMGKLLEQHLDSTSSVLDFYFRLESLESTARALSEGALRYGERGSADQLAAMVARSFDDRQRFRDYAKDLVQNLEANFKVADEEAQRCRADMNRQPKRGKRS